MTNEEREAAASKHKDEGTEWFKQKAFKEAITSYEEACSMLDSISGYESLWVSCKLNSAQASLNLTLYPDAIKFASEALSKDPKNVKALYRRGVARIHIGSLEEALEDLNLALSLDPGSA